MKTLANPVQGENLEDLHPECQRSARHLLNSVYGETLKICESPSTTRNWNVDVLLHNPLQQGYDLSTSFSASCVSRTAVRIGTSSGKILGTSITCSGSGVSVSKKCMMSSICSTICGAGSSRVGNEGTASTI